MRSDDHCSTCRFSTKERLTQFQRLGWKAAEDIRSGSLSEDSDVSQVHKSSWNRLASINRDGLLTFDSQDARGTQNERAYVSGFMETGDSRKFVEDINLTTDKMALLLVPVSKQRRSSVAVTRQLADPRDANTGEYISVTRVHLYSTKKELDFLKKTAGITRDIDVNLVVVIDPVWGRPATSKRGLFGDISKSLNWFDTKVSKMKNAVPPSRRAKSS